MTCFGPGSARLRMTVGLPFNDCRAPPFRGSLSQGVGAGNSVVVVDRPRWGPMLSPRVPNLVPIPGPRMERETPGQRPRPNYGHPQGTAPPVP